MPGGALYKYDLLSMICCKTKGFEDIPICMIINIMSNS
jgi:hypothetical protein